MIYKASHNKLIYAFFRLYTCLKIKRNFHGVRIKGEFTDRGLPVLIISNHFSWWDGFWAEYLNMKVFKRKFYFMMLEEQLKKHMFFNKTGGYSVKKGSSSVIESLNYTAELLANPGNLVLMFPQGRFDSMHNHNIRFEKGVGYVLGRVQNTIHIIFVANFIEYFSEEKPGLIIHFTEFSGNELSTANLEKEYNTFFSACRADNIRLALK
ncbi:MAG: glycerol acyltransferase [Bacteroidales bacterium]|jgi:hypothetical protein|nr:glycerol acyltransferase [Bacteroidales bacterium]